MANEKALSEWRYFLESKPAYTPVKIAEILVDHPGLFGHFGLASPRIQLYCEADDGVRWFQPQQQWVNVPKGDTRHYHFVRYTCRDCGLEARMFAVMIARESLGAINIEAMKLGEFPPFGSHLAKRLKDLLAKSDLELYRKGLRTEREGHGIGAAAYYRRVVENQWKALIRKLRDAAARLGTPEERLKVFDEALNQQQFSAAVEMLKDAIPAKLLILDGRNPLTLLYKPLSVQIHNLNDDGCLQQAADIRVVLNELFDNIGRVLADDEALKGAVRRLEGGADG